MLKRMDYDDQVKHWTGYFSCFQATSLFTLRCPKAKSAAEAEKAARKILYNLCDGTGTNIKALTGVGIYCGSKYPAERHVHLLLNTNSEPFNSLNNKKNSHGVRPSLPLKRRHPFLDHADALEVSPVYYPDGAYEYMARNRVNHGDHPATDIFFHRHSSQADPLEALPTPWEPLQSTLAA